MMRYHSVNDTSTPLRTSKVRSIGTYEYICPTIYSKYFVIFLFRTQTTVPVVTPTMTTLLLLCLPSLREEGVWLNPRHQSATIILLTSPRLPSTDRQQYRKDCRNWPSRQENSSSEPIILLAMSGSIQNFHLLQANLIFAYISC